MGRKSGVSKRGLSVSAKADRSHHWGSFPSLVPSLFCPVIGPAATSLFGPCIVAVLSAGEWPRGIRPAGEDPCCSSSAYLPCHLSWMFDAFRSLILPTNQRRDPYKITHSHLDWRDEGDRHVLQRSIVAQSGNSPFGVGLALGPRSCTELGMG